MYTYIYTTFSKYVVLQEDYIYIAFSKYVVLQED
jgi:hypothetical protein